ncbi:MAG: B12-binding domain-containing radical SAM protein [Armatimonadetes bacterium]|nr:B12-binding domain-containing radical SAM protein [Armatimonadota bacterium]
MRIALMDAIDERDRKRKLMPPLGLAYLAGYLLEKLPHIDVAIFEDSRDVIEFAPDLVGISSMTPNFPAALSLSQDLKARLSCPLILGGPHITSLPAQLPPQFDAGVLGEGEETLLGLVQRFEKDRWEKSLESLRGIVYRHAGNVRIAPEGDLIEPLDSIPHPRRDLMDFQGRAPYLMTSRGCPCKCAFCYPAQYWRKYRVFSPRYVVSEMEEIVQGYPIRQLVVLDDFFTAHLDRLKEIAGLMEEKGLPEKIGLYVEARADSLGIEACRILKQMNVQCLNFGIESASDKVLQYLKKAPVTVAQIEGVIEMCLRFGFSLAPSFMFGSPPETREDMEALYRFISEHKDHFVSIEMFPAVPLPGTEMWEYASQQGLVSEQMDWSRLTLSLLDFDPERHVFMNRNVSKEEFCDFVLRFQELYREINKKTLAVMASAVAQVERARAGRRVYLPSSPSPGLASDDA